jgi:hypothetical protein
MIKVLSLPILFVIAIGKFLVFLVDATSKFAIGYFFINHLLGGILGPEHLEED